MPRHRQHRRKGRGRQRPVRAEHLSALHKALNLLSPGPRRRAPAARSGTARARPRLGSALRNPAGLCSLSVPSESLSVPCRVPSTIGFGAHGRIQPALFNVAQLSRFSSPPALPLQGRAPSPPLRPRGGEILQHAAIEHSGLGARPEPERLATATQPSPPFTARG